MKASTALALLVIFFFPMQQLYAKPNGKEESVMNTKIRIVFGDQEAIIKMLDNPASRDFMSLLPLTLEFSDYAKSEKIAHLPRRLNTKNSPTPPEASGDFTYYAPWGNLAVFYQGFGSDEHLYVLGCILSGKEALATTNKNFTARIEKID